MKEKEEIKNEIKANDILSLIFFPAAILSVSATWQLIVKSKVK
jgi:hypothetical protein